MFRVILFISLIVLGFTVYSQNDLDAIRYSRTSVNGSSRFVSMGGAFGAIGADMSCAAFNPAGIGIYRKGEISFSGGLITTFNEGDINGKSSNISNAAFNFNYFGILGIWPSKLDKESRHLVCFTNTQIQNFTNKIRVSSYTNNNSILKDMLEKAKTAGSSNKLNPSYEGLAFETLLLDTFYNNFISLVDTKRTVLQTRDIVTSGKTNERNFSYAYAYKDKFYFGLSIGLPKVEFTSTTTHVEKDDKDSTRIGLTSPGTYTNTFIGGLPGLNGYYANYLGFNSLNYTEYFKTTGSGINFKFGGISRVSDFFRFGFYYHTPTIYNLKDDYYNSMTAYFDKDPSKPTTTKSPKEGGYFEYSIITPGKLSLNTAFVIKKISVIGIDYEMINYKSAYIMSNNVSDFAGVNTVIKNKYKTGHNFRVGTELNLKPIMFRIGYNLNGSPFGNTFNGNFSRHIISFGAGFRTKNNIYFDFVWFNAFTTEDYYLYNSLSSKAILHYQSANLSFTAGIKF